MTSKRRVLGGCADEEDRAVLNVRKDRVLLALVEAVDLVDEENRALSVHAEPIRGLAHDGAKLRDAGRDGADGHELGACFAGDEPGKGGFP